MIIPDFLELTEIGLYCKVGDFYLDPSKPVKSSVVSHAHGDHAYPGSVDVYCTEPTSQIMQYRYKKKAAAQFHTYPYKKPFKLNGIDICFCPAGHILGSAQVLMTYKGMNYLYTGDIKLQPDLTCEGYELVKADVLITETTFANPETQHPDPVLEIKKLNTINYSVILGAYALGKAQRISRMIQDHCPQRKVLMHYSITGINHIYEKNGFNLGLWEHYDRRLSKQYGNNFVYIVPPLTFHSYIRVTNAVRLFASGFDRRRANDEHLFISDHIDWNDLLSLIEQVQPKEIWTLHGDGSLLKEHFSKKGIPVKLLNSK